MDSKNFDKIFDKKIYLYIFIFRYFFLILKLQIIYCYLFMINNLILKYDYLKKNV